MDEFDRPADWPSADDLEAMASAWGPVRAGPAGEGIIPQLEETMGHFNPENAPEPTRRVVVRIHRLGESSQVRVEVADVTLDHDGRHVTETPIADAGGTGSPAELVGQAVARFLAPETAVMVEHADLPAHGALFMPNVGDDGIRTGYAVVQVAATTAGQLSKLTGLLDDDQVQEAAASIAVALVIGASIIAKMRTVNRLAKAGSDKVDPRYN